MEHFPGNKQSAISSWSAATMVGTLPPLHKWRRPVTAATPVIILILTTAPVLVSTTIGLQMIDIDNSGKYSSIRIVRNEDIAM